MTKDGRPSRLCDIRLFVDQTGYLKDHEEVWAFARRLAWRLNGEGFSIGAHTHMYLMLSPTTPLGTAVASNVSVTWWHRYVFVGAPSAIGERAEDDEKLKACIVTALKTCRPDSAALIDEAVAAVERHGERLRYPVRRWTTKRHAIDAYCTIAAWPMPSELVVSIRDHQTQTQRETPPIAVAFYGDVFDMVAAVKIDEANVKIIPAALASARGDAAPVIVPIASLTAPPSELAVAKLVKPLG